MFCNKCGKQIEDAAGFCPFCGKEVEYSPEEKSKQYKVRHQSNTIKEVRKPARTKYMIAILIIMVFLIIGSIILFFILKGKNSSTEGNETKSKTSAESTDSDIESVEPEEDEALSTGEKVDNGSQEEGISDLKKSYLYADTPDEAFTNYMSVFTNAVNTGDYSKANSIMLEGSSLYKQQQSLVNELYGKKITEQVENFYIKSTEEISPTKIRIISDEEIKLIYKDGTSKNLRQSYGYICELTDDGWLFTNIEEVP